MAGIFPFLNAPASVGQKKELSLFREYGWNFGTNSMLLENGAPVIVEGKEALRVWIYKALSTVRYRHLGYSSNYGCELENLIGSTYTQGATRLEVERYVREALLVSPYITAVPQVNISMAGDRLTGSVTVQTVYGEVNVDV